MSSIEFTYNGASTIIQCNEKDKLKEIIKRFVTKAQLEKENLFYLYGGNPINDELTFEEIKNKVDKDENKIKILVNLLNDTETDEKSRLIKSKEITNISRNSVTILLNKKGDK